MPAVELVNLRRLNSKTFDLGNGQRRLVTSIGAMHYKDGAGIQQDIDENFSGLDVEGFSAKFSKCLYHIRVADNSTRRIYPDRNDLSYWIQLEKPNGIAMGAPIKSGNTWTWDFLHAQIKIQMQSSQVKFNFILKDSQAPTSITIPFSVQGITRTGNILYHNGEPVAELRKPVAVDSSTNGIFGDGVRRDCSVTFGSVQLTISLDTTGLTFPIDIDPTVNTQVGASTDDVYRRMSPDYYDTDNTQGAVGNAGIGNKQNGNGFRFDISATPIPSGATINDGTVLKVTANSPVNGTVVRTRISAESSLNAATFSTSGDFDTRYAGRTIARIDWDVPAFTAETVYSSPEIKTVIQELVNTGQLNKVALFWEDFDGRSDIGATNYRVNYSWDSSTTKAPKLDITYTVPPPKRASSCLAKKMIAVGGI